MNPDTFTPKSGDTVYSGDGNAAIYIGQTPCGGHAVSVLYENDEGADPYGVTEWRQVFKDAPHARLDAAIAEKTETKARLTAQVIELQKRQREEQAAYDALTKTLSQRSRVLQRINDWIDGKFTHYVIDNSWGPVVILEVGKDIDCDKEPRLLSLRGKSKGDLEYRLGQYSDHSGSSEVVHLAASEDEAKDLLREINAARIDEWRKKDGRNLHGFGYIEQSLKSIGDELPEDIAALVNAQRERAKAENLRKAEEALEAARKDAGLVTA